MLVWAVVYRLGTIDHGKLATHVALGRLVAAGRIAKVETAALVTYRAETFVAPLGEAHGWEAAVFDHFQAMVTTICRKLGDAGAPALADEIGGSTYTLEVWPGHPMEEEVRGELAAFRTRLGELRDRVVRHNRGVTVPARRSKVVVYGGQCITEQEDEDEDE
jgi:hypothetical protein